MTFNSFVIAHLRIKDVHENTEVLYENEYTCKSIDDYDDDNFTIKMNLTNRRNKLLFYMMLFMKP
jgi:hypothetical protein